MSESNAPSAVIDTNVFVSGTINPHGRPRQVLRAWHEGRFKLILSDRQHAELITVFSRPKIIRQFRITLIELTELIARIGAVTPIVPSSSIPVSLRDPKDEHILAAALVGKADYLVTGDDDLLVHQGDPRLGALQIVTASQFLDALDDSDITN
jgi:putative PIN family toxin of toxin-antitoxin system